MHAHRYSKEKEQFLHQDSENVVNFPFKTPFNEIMMFNNKFKMYHSRNLSVLDFYIQKQSKKRSRNADYYYNNCFRTHVHINILMFKNFMQSLCQKLIKMSATAVWCTHATCQNSKTLQNWSPLAGTDPPDLKEWHSFFSQSSKESLDFICQVAVFQRISTVLLTLSPKQC